MKQVRKIGALLMAVAVMAASTVVPSFATEADMQDTGYTPTEICVSKAEAVDLEANTETDGEAKTQTYSFAQNEDGKIVVFDKDGNEIKINFEQVDGELTVSGDPEDAVGYSITIGAND